MASHPSVRRNECRGGCPSKPWRSGAQYLRPYALRASVPTSRSRSEARAGSVRRSLVQRWAFNTNISFKFSKMVNPILLQLGSVVIYYQGVFLTLGVILATFLFWRRAKREGFDQEKILDLSLVSLLFAFIGARLFFVLFNLSVFSGDWWDVFRSLGSGLNFYGGLLFGLLGAWFFVRKQEWSLLKLADAAAPSVALGQVFGSVSVLVSRLSLPTTKYQIAAHLVIFIFLIFVEKRRIFNIFGKIRTGYLAGLYLALSGLTAFII